MAQPGPAVPPPDLAERTAATAPGPAPTPDTVAREGSEPPPIGFAQVALGLWIVLGGVLFSDLPREAWIPVPVGVIIFFLGLIGLTRMPVRNASNL
jgi:hypothetical protein